jgi:hypothetical protein
MTRPLGFLFPHVGFFGPLVVLMVVYWSRVSASARRIGFGFDATFALLLFFCFNSESRGMLAITPVILPLVPLACAQLPWTPRRLLELFGFTLFATKLWYSTVQTPTIDFETISAHMGPWMGNDAMILHAIGTGLILWWILWAMKKTPPREEVVWLGEEQP